MRKEGFILFLLLLSVSHASVSYYQYYGSFTVNEPDSEIGFSYSYDSGITPEFSLKLFRVYPGELHDYQSKNHFEDLVKEWHLRAPGKLHRKFIRSEYDPGTLKHNSIYEWTWRYEKDGRVGMKLGKGIYVYRQNAYNSLVVVSDLDLQYRTDGSKHVFLVTKDGISVPCDFYLISDSGLQEYHSDEGVLEASGLHEMIYVRSGEDELAFVIPQYYSYQYYDQQRSVIYTDRPVYRPNQTIYYKAIFWEEGPGKNLLSGNRVDLQIYDSKYQAVYREQMYTDSYGAVAGSYFIPEDAATGDYSIRINDPFYAYSAFKVEEYRKPEFSLDLEFDKPFFLEKESVTGTINASYYFGEPVPDLTVGYEIYGTPEHRPCSGFYDCMSTKQYYGGIGELEHKGTVQTGTQGTASISFRPKAKGYQETYNIVLKAADKSRKEVEKTAQVKVAPALFRLSAYPERYYYGAGDLVEVKVSAMDHAGQPVTTYVDAAVFRRDYYLFGKYHESLQETKSFEVQEGKGSFSIIPQAGGEYAVNLSSEDELGNPVHQQFVFRVYSDSVRFYSQDLQLSTDREYYVEGDTATVFIELPEPGASGILSVEGASLHKAIPLSTSSSIILAEVPIEEGYSPNVYISYSYVKDGMRYSSSKNIPVPPTDKALNLTIRTDRSSYSTGQEVIYDIQATDSAGTPARASLSLGIVDEAIYDIYPDTSADLFLSFNQQVSNTVQSYFTQVARAEQGSAAYLVIAVLVLLFLLLLAGFFYIYIDFIKGKKVWAIITWIGASAISIYLMLIGLGVFLIDWYVLGIIILLMSLAIVPLILCMLVVGIGGIFIYAMKRVSKEPKKVSIKWPIIIVVVIVVMVSLFMLFLFSMSFGRSFVSKSSESLQSMDMANSVGSMPLPSFAGGLAREEEEALPEPKIRRYFPDTMYWKPDIETDIEGKATVKVTLPDSLTTWRATLKGYTKDFDAGSVLHSIVVKQDVIVRLVAPRTLTQTDTLTVSGNVHNYGDDTVTAYVSLSADNAAQVVGETMKTVSLPPGSDERVDFQVKAEGCCNTTLKVVAKTVSGSDAMELVIPVVPKGIMESESEAGMIQDSYEKRFSIPYDIDTEASSLTYRLSPTLAGSAISSLSYLADYPYGCAEQTMNKFLPDLIVVDTIRKLGLREPYLESELPRMVESGVKRLYELQNPDGGFGWWNNDMSSPYMSAYVAHGLWKARELGFPVDSQRITDALSFLEHHVSLESDPNLQAYEFYVLSETEPVELPPILFGFGLNSYGRAMMAMALHNNDDARYKGFMDRLADDATCSDSGCYWESEGSWRYTTIETTSQAVIALLRTGHDPALAEKGIMYLLSQRKGDRWRSTRDTAIAIEAIAMHLSGSGELDAEYTIRIYQDDALADEIRITRENILKEHIVILDPEPDTRIRIEKSGPGKLYFNSLFDYYITSERISPKGSGFHVERQYSTASAHPGHEMEVTLRIKADKDYEYVHLEEFFPSGCEFVKGQHLNGTHYDIRDEKLDIFYTRLSAGEQTIKYRLRAEIPGTYTAMPARTDIMYLPEVFGHSGTTGFEII